MRENEWEGWFMSTYYGTRQIDTSVVAHLR